MAGGTRTSPSSTDQVGALDAQDHQSDGTHRGRTDSAQPRAHCANRPYRLGMQRLVLEAALGDPAGAAKLLAMPEHVDTALVLFLTGDRGLSVRTTTRRCRAGERLVTKLQGEAPRPDSSVLVRRRPRTFATGVSASRALRRFR